MSGGEDAAIRVEGLTRRFGRRWALRGVDLHVRSGEVVTLLGANGTGKTTLLRVLATLLRPTGGTAAVCGRDVMDEADAIRGLTALMTPLGHVYDELTGVENLRFAARMLGVPSDRAPLVERLDAVGLAESADIVARSYSTGMRKRLELARIGLADPRVVLLDEPFTSLDEDGVELVQRAIAGWREAGKTVLLASHRAEEARRHADRSVRLEAGRVREPAA